MATTESHEEPKHEATPTKHAVDGFTWKEIYMMATQSVVTARCIYCEAESEVEPDAQNYNCCKCGGAETVTSPLVKLGLI